MELTQQVKLFNRYYTFNSSLTHYSILDDELKVVFCNISAKNDAHPLTAFYESHAVLLYGAAYSSALKAYIKRVIMHELLLLAKFCRDENITDGDFINVIKAANLYTM